MNAGGWWCGHGAGRRGSALLGDLASHFQSEARRAPRLAWKGPGHPEARPATWSSGGRRRRLGADPARRNLLPGARLQPGLLPVSRRGASVTNCCHRPSLRREEVSRSRRFRDRRRRITHPDVLRRPRGQPSERSRQLSSQPAPAKRRRSVSWRDYLRCIAAQRIEDGEISGDLTPVRLHLLGVAVYSAFVMCCGDHLSRPHVAKMSCRACSGRPAKLNTQVLLHRHSVGPDDGVSLRDTAYYHVRPVESFRVIQSQDRPSPTFLSGKKRHFHLDYCYRHLPI